VGALKSHHTLCQAEIYIFSPKEGQASLGKLVVHDCVKHVAFQPALGFGWDFADDVSLWVGSFDYLAKFAPEIIIIYFKGHVQAPTIRAFINPVASNIKNILPHLGVVGIEFRQGRQVPPAAVVWLTFISVQRETADIKPIQVR